MPGFDNEVMNSQGSDVGVFPNTSTVDNSTEFSRSGSEVTSIVNNTSNTASSGASSTVRVEGTTAADPYNKFQIGSSDSWAVGIDNSDSQLSLRVLYRDDGNVTPSSFTNLPARFEAIDPITGTCTSVFRTNLAVASEGTASGSTVDLNVQNVELAASSDARINIQVAGASGGNPFLSWSGLADSYSFGIDRADSNILKIVDNGILTGSSLMECTSAGEFTFPLTPAFLTQLEVTDALVTGDGTVYTVVYDNEIFDQGGNFDGTSTFTAPVTGRYSFTFCIRMDGIVAAHTDMEMAVVTSNRSYITNKLDPGDIDIPTNAMLGLTMTVLADMDAADTATTTLTVSNGNLLVNAVGSLDPLTETYFSGKLEA